MRREGAGFEELMQAALAGRLTRREVLKRGIALGLNAVAISTLLAACGGGGSKAPASPAAPGSGAPAPAAGAAGGAGAVSQIVVAQPSDVLTLDPSKDTSPISLNVFKNVFDQLTDILADGSVGPLLAESWKSSDAITWDFTLVSGAKFHDGSPVTADDVLWSFQKVMGDAKSPVQAYTVAIAKIEKVNDRTIRFVTKYPYAPFPRQVSLISILPKAAYEKLGPEKFALEPVGSGPYRVVKWVKDDRLTLEANADYFKGAPPVKTVIFRPVPSENTRLAALESGELDIVPLLPPSELQRLRKNDKLRVQLVESNRNLYIGINVKTPPLNNLKLRRAMDMAIDRNAITTQLLSGMGKPIGQAVAPVTFGYDPSIEPTKFDPDQAKKLVAESGYKGEEILFQFPNNRYQFGTEVAEAVAGALANVGIKVKLQGMEYSAFFPLWTGKKFTGLHMFAFGPSIMDADLPLGSLYDSKSGRGYWESAEIDELVKQQRAAADNKQRLEIIRKIWQLSQENVPYIWLYNEVQAYGIRNRVDWTPRADERLTMQYAKLKG